MFFRDFIEQEMIILMDSESHLIRGRGGSDVIFVLKIGFWLCIFIRKLITMNCFIIFMEFDV